MCEVAVLLLIVFQCVDFEKMGFKFAGGYLQRGENGQLLCFGGEGGVEMALSDKVSTAVADYTGTSANESELEMDYLERY